MLLADLLATANQGLQRNRVRSLLTTLGIVIGVGSVVLMVSIGASFQAYIFNQLSTISASTINVFPKGLEQFGKSLDTIDFQDVEAIRKLPTVTAVAPSIIVPQEVTYEGEKADAQVMGALPELFPSFGLVAEQGRLLTQDDARSSKSIAVIGPDVVEKFFPGEDAIGKRIAVGNRNFTVIGVTKSLGSLSGNDVDAMVTIPLSIAKSMTGQNYVSYVVLQAKDDVDLAVADITDLLRSRHRISNPANDPDKDDFLVRTTAQATAILGTVTLSLTIFLTLIAGISLLVGGVGIMNIMFVAVTERTAEIGLRKAVGATGSDILRQFLLEAVALTTLGGLVGTVGGIALTYVIVRVADAYLGDFPFALSWIGILGAVAMAMGTGLVFGLYPASRAAKMQPIEALRWE